MQSKCFLKKVCQPTEIRLLQLHSNGAWKRRNAKKISDFENGKDVPNRFPNHTDSIGIEMGGGYKTVEAVDKILGKKDSYNPVTEAQNKSLKGLIVELARTLNVSMAAAHHHPNVGRKNTTEARTAKW